jgi:prevent-host-death family protein
MTRRIVPAGEFKARCLKLMEEVRDTGEEIVITKRGKPVARLLPPEPRGAPKSLFGYMKGTIKIVGNIVEPLDVAWDPVKEWDRLERQDLKRPKKKSR